MPIGVIIARYLKASNTGPAWFYLHVFCQCTAYAAGVFGRATDLILDYRSLGIQHTIHRYIGIALIVSATLQVCDCLDLDTVNWHSHPVIYLTIFVWLLRFLLSSWGPRRNINYDKYGTYTTIWLATAPSSWACSMFSKALIYWNPRRSGRLFTSLWFLGWESFQLGWSLLWHMWSLSRRRP